MVEQIRQGDIPGVQLRYRHHLDARVEESWTWLTEPDRQVQWLGEHARIESGSGQTFVLESTDAGGNRQREQLVTQRIDPPREWVLDLQNLDGSWPVPTRLSIELTASADGTEISVLQAGFAHLPLSECLTIWETYRRRWRTALTTLADLIASAANPR